MLQNMTEYNNNGIRIQSAVLPQLTCADRQMGRTNVQ